LLLLGVLVCCASDCLAQLPTWQDAPSLFWNANPLSSGSGSESMPMPMGRVPRMRLFCIAPGFLTDPLGMQEDECELPGVQSMPGSNLSALPSASADGPEWIQFGMGADNPYFDLRRPGDPGGVGYYRVNTQVALLNSPRTACTLGIQTVTPTGIQFAGMPDGPTVLSPAFSFFHALGDNFAVQGFLAKNVPISNADGTCVLQRHVQYGMALQRPLVVAGPDGLRNLFFSFGALGQLQPERDRLGLVPSYDVLPGLQWHVNDNWWLSSAVLMPVGTVHTAPGQWQLTCSLQF
jgi:hypothetical protein